jgi:hypothetical protein
VTRAAKVHLQTTNLHGKKIPGVRGVDRPHGASFGRDSERGLSVCHFLTGLIFSVT